jgi:hypothetical protein
VRQVSSAGVLPRALSIDVGDDAEQRHLRRGDVAVQGVRDPDQPIGVEIGAGDGSVHVFEDRRGSNSVQ